MPMSIVIGPSFRAGLPLSLENANHSIDSAPIFLVHGFGCFRDRQLPSRPRSHASSRASASDGPWPVTGKASNSIPACLRSLSRLAWPPASFGRRPAMISLCTAYLQGSGIITEIPAPCSKIERMGSRIKKSMNLNGSADAPPRAGMLASSAPLFVVMNSTL